MPRPKGSKNKKNDDVKTILHNNSGYLLNLAIKQIEADPEKNSGLLQTLLNKIIPTQTINTNVDLTQQYLNRLQDVQIRANLLLGDKQPETIEVEIMPKNATSETKDNEKPGETPCNDTPEQDPNLKNRLNSHY